MIDDALIQRLPDWLRGNVLGIELWQYLAILFVLLIGLVVRKIIEYVVRNRVRHLVEHLGQAWAARLVDVFTAPGATLVMAIVLRIAYPALRLPEFAAGAVIVAVRLLVVLSLTWAAYRLVDVLAERLLVNAARTDSRLDDQLVPLVRKSLKIFAIVGGCLFALQNMDVNIGSLLAGLGIGGVAVALAAKDTIANFFGSVMIFADRPFQIGDWVSIGDVEGVVEEVGFRSTRIRTFYNSVVTVPNAKFMEANIDNYGRRQYRRTSVTLKLTHGTSPEQIQAFVEGVRSILKANAYTRKDFYEVHLAGFGSSSLDVMVYFFFEVDSWSAELRERHNVFLEIIRLARELRVSFAFPTQTLHVDSLAAPGQTARVDRAPATAELAEIVHAFGPSGARARPSGIQIAGAERGSAR